MGRPINWHQEPTVLNVDKDPQLVLPLAVLARETRVRVERLKGDPLLSDTEGKEDASHRRNFQDTTSFFNDVLVCILEREERRGREGGRERK